MCTGAGAGAAAGAGAGAGAGGTNGVAHTKGNGRAGNGAGSDPIGTGTTTGAMSGTATTQGPTVRRESLAEQAAELLLARVRDKEWEIGGKLPGETTLTPQLGVGRSTMREAIRILAGRGILATRQGAGVFATATDVPANWDSAFDRAGIVAVIEARTAIEVEAAALAAERHTSAELKALRRALDDRERHRADIGQHIETDFAFHRGIVLAAHSPVLLELFDGFESRSRQAMTDMLALRGHHGDDADHDTHEHIYEAVASRDAAAAAALTRAHLTMLRDLLA